MSTPSSSIETSPVLPRRNRHVADPHDTGRTVRADRDRDALEQLLVEAGDLVDILLRGVRDPKTKQHVGLSALQLVDRARVVKRPIDGMGNHSPGSEPPAAPARNVLDSEGRIIEHTGEPGYEISDPTGNAAIAAIGYQDPDRVAATKLARDVAQAVNQLRHAANTLQRATADDDTSEPVGDPGCKCHARLRSWEPVTDLAPNSELCRWCYDFWRTYGFLPPDELVEYRIQGRRMTSKLIDSVIKRNKRAARR